MAKSPYKNQCDLKIEKVNVRVTEENKSHLLQVARKQGLSLSQLLLKLIEKEIRTYHVKGTIEL